MPTRAKERPIPTGTVPRGRANDRVNIVVVGLKGDQRDQVRRRWRANAPRNSRVRLRFVESGRPPEEVLPGANACVIAKFNAHRWSVAARKRLPRDAVYFLRGGLGQIAEAIGDIARQSTSTTVASC